MEILHNVHPSISIVLVGQSHGEVPLGRPKGAEGVSNVNDRKI
jgi:hypothetical protein